MLHIHGTSYGDVYDHIGQRNKIMKERMVKQFATLSLDICINCGTRGLNFYFYDFKVNSNGFGTIGSLFLILMIIN